RPIVAPDGYWTIDVQTLSASEWIRDRVSAPFPNPAVDKVNFELGDLDGPTSVRISNILGQNLYQTEVESNGVITLALLPNWQETLFITFENQMGKVTRKVIKL